MRDFDFQHVDTTDFSGAGLDSSFLAKLEELENDFENAVEKSSLPAWERELASSAMREKLGVAALLFARLPATAALDAVLRKLRSAPDDDAVEQLASNYLVHALA
jgi:hypothetical protein